MPWQCGCIEARVIVSAYAGGNEEDELRGAGKNDDVDGQLTSGKSNIFGQSH